MKGVAHQDERFVQIGTVQVDVLELELVLQPRRHLGLPSPLLPMLLETAATI